MSIILGMGVPGVAAYVIVYAVAVPVLLYALILLLKLAKNKEQKAQELVDESLKQAKAVPEDETDSPEHTEA